MKRFLSLVLVAVVSCACLFAGLKSSDLELGAGYSAYCTPKSGFAEHSMSFDFGSFDTFDGSDSVGFHVAGSLQVPLATYLNGEKASVSYRFKMNVAADVGVWFKMAFSPSDMMLATLGFGLEEVARVTDSFSGFGIDLGVAAGCTYRHVFGNGDGLDVGFRLAAYFAEFQYIKVSSGSTTQWAKDFFTLDIHPYVAYTIHIPYYKAGK